MILLKDLAPDAEIINKATMSDKRSILSQNLKLSFKTVDNFDWLYLEDFDETSVYFEVYDYDTSAYITYKVDYTFNGTMATFGETVSEVVKTTTYEDVVAMTTDVDKSFSDKVLDVLQKSFGKTKGSSPLIKQFEDEQMIAIEPLYIAAGDVDGQGDTYTLDETHSMVESFNKANEEGILQSSLFHKHKTESFSVVKAWVNPYPCQIGETLIKAGQPLAEIQFHSEEAWELRKEGTLMGLSIGARATEVEEV
jgi:hypothetical protein